MVEGVEAQRCRDIMIGDQDIDEMSQNVEMEVVDHIRRCVAAGDVHCAAALDAGTRSFTNLRVGGLGVTTLESMLNAWTGRA